MNRQNADVSRFVCKIRLNWKNVLNQDQKSRSLIEARNRINLVCVFFFFGEEQMLDCQDER